MSRKAVRAEKFKLKGDDAIHWDPRPALLGQQETGLHVATACAKAEHGSQTRGRAAEAVQREMGSAGRQVADAGGRLVGGEGRRVERPFSSEGSGKFELGVVDVDGNHTSTRGPGDHHGRQAHAAATVNGHPLAGL